MAHAPDPWVGQRHRVKVAKIIYMPPNEDPKAEQLSQSVNAEIERRVSERLKEIQERLGHSSITVTLDRYGHLFPGLDERLAERLDEMARAVKEPASTPAGEAAS